MKWKSACGCLWLVLGAAGAIAQNPFVGTWKLNQEKSQLTGEIITFHPAMDQSLSVTAAGISYSFRTDGKNYMMPSGDLASWKQVDASKWTTDYRGEQGKLFYSDTWMLSGDNESLTVVSTGVKPNGQTFKNTAVYIRTAGTDGLAGSWKSTEVHLDQATMLTIGSYGLGGLAITVPGMKAVLLAAFDGTDVKPTGPEVPPGLTLALFRIGPSSFRMVRKIRGRVTYSSRFTVSADSQTMTEIGNAIGDPSQTRVWEKQ